MVTTFDVDIPNLERFIAGFKHGDRVAQEEMTTAGKRSGLAVERKAKGYVRVWRGHLRRSITSSKTPFGTTVSPFLITTKIGTNLPYAKAENFGRPADAPMPPPGALLPWMAAKGIAPSGEFEGRDDLSDVSTTRRSSGGYFPVEYLIARAIKRKAPDPHPYLTKAFDELKPAIRKEFELARNRIIKRLKAGA